MEQTQTVCHLVTADHRTDYWGGYGLISGRIAASPYRSPLRPPKGWLLENAAEKPECGHRIDYECGLQ